MVAVFAADGQQAELREAAIGIEHEIVACDRLQFAPDVEVRVAAVGERHVRTAEELPVLLRTYEHDLGVGPTPPRAIHDHTGERDVRAERNPREHHHTTRLERDRPRNTLAEVTLDVGARYRLREE